MTSNARAALLRWLLQKPQGIGEWFLAFGAMGALAVVLFVARAGEWSKDASFVGVIVALVVLSWVATLSIGFLLMWANRPEMPDRVLGGRRGLRAWLLVLVLWLGGFVVPTSLGRLRGLDLQGDALLLVGVAAVWVAGAWLAARRLVTRSRRLLLVGMLSWITGLLLLMVPFAAEHLGHIDAAGGFVLDGWVVGFAFGAAAAGTIVPLLGELHAKRHAKAPEPPGPDTGLEAAARDGSLTPPS